MPRGLTSEQKTRLAARARALAYLVELELDGETVRVWDGTGDLNALDETWKGLGQFGILDGLESDRALKGQTLSLSLHGIPGSAISGTIMEKTRSTNYQNRPLTVYLLFLDVETQQPVDEPTVVWVGLADTISFRLGSTISVSLSAEHFSSRARRSNGNRMTTESHNARLGNPDPRDLLFDPQNRLLGKAKVQI